MQKHAVIWVLLGHFPPVYCELFEFHCSKLKLDPIANLCQTSVLCITHCAFFFGIRKYPLYGFFSQRIQLFILWSVAIVLSKLQIIRPDMFCRYLYIIRVVCTFA